MSPLLDQQKRGRARAARAERLAKILEAAKESILRRSYADIELDSLAKGAGVPQGLPSMYFGSKEELFLLLTRREVSAWYDVLQTELSAREQMPEEGQLAALLAESLAANPVLVRLLSLLHVVLEQTLDPMAVEALRRGLFDRMADLGALLEQRCPFLTAGEGPELLRRLEHLAVGLHSAASPFLVGIQVIQDEDLRVFQIDFERELEALLLAVLRGSSRSHGRAEQ